MDRHAPFPPAPMSEVGGAGDLRCSSDSGGVPTSLDVRAGLAARVSGRPRAAIRVRTRFLGRGLPPPRFMPSLPLANDRPGRHPACGGCLRRHAHTRALARARPGAVRPGAGRKSGSRLAEAFVADGQCLVEQGAAGGDFEHRSAASKGRSPTGEVWRRGAGSTRLTFSLLVARPGGESGPGDCVPGAGRSRRRDRVIPLSTPCRIATCCS